MTFTSPLPRIEPPRTNPEVAALNTWLDYNRATLLRKLDGLTEEQADLDPDTVIVTRRGATIDVRWVMLGQIQEYARHNGHADVLRELIDGTTGE